MDILAGEKLYIEDAQVPDGTKALTDSIKALGGVVVSSPEEATGILVNPAHKSYTATSSSPPRIIYTWPAHCAAARARVDPSTLPPPVLLNHWRAGYEGLPVTVYVSVNLRRMRADEEPRATKAAVEAALARLGALIVAKRSMADILVIDRKTAFFLDKITGEVRKAGRDWQRFAEREWAEAVIKEGRMLPLQSLEGEIMPGPDEGPSQAPSDVVEMEPAPRAQPAPQPGDIEVESAGPSAGPAPQPPQPADDADVDMDGEGATAPTPIIRPSSQKEREEEARRQREDSFAEDDDADAVFYKKAPGRPTGKPRNEYSPEDDDLLCRYLAWHNPGGSWNSRKTYQMMADRVGLYDWVARHTWQSWLERFKKNSVAFGKRVNRYMKSGLDDSLKTAAERQAERERASAKGKEKATEAPDSETQGGAKRKGKENEAGPSSPIGAGKGKESEGTPSKRRLVSSEDEDDEAPRKKDPPRLALGRNRPGSGFPTQPPRPGAREPLFMPGPSSSLDVPETVEPVAPYSPPVSSSPPAGHARAPEVATKAPARAPAAEPQPEQEAPPAQQQRAEAVTQAGVDTPGLDQPSGQQQSAPERPSAPAAPTLQAPAAPTSPTLPVPAQTPTAAPAAAPSASPATPTPAQPPPAAQPPASPAAYAPRPSAVADLIDRRRTPRRARHTLATVAAPHSQPSRRRIVDTVSVSPGQLRTPAPPPRESTSFTPQAPLTPAQLQQKLEAGREIVTHAAQTYRGYIDRWLHVFGVGQAEIMAAVEEVRGRTNLTRAPIVFGEVERVLEERYGRL